MTEAGFPATASTPESLRRTALNLSLLTVAVALAGYWSLYVPHDLGFVTPIWAPNAMTLAFVLRNPGGGPRWLGVLAGVSGLFAASLAIGDDVATSLVLSTSNMLEVTICAVGLRRIVGETFDPGRVRHLAWGAALAFAGSFAGALVASTYLTLMRGRHVLTGLTVWTLSDALGLLILTPCLLILTDWRRYAAERRITAAGWLMLAAAAAFEAALFGQMRYPLLFLAPLPVLVGSIALEMVGAAVLVLVVAVAAVGFTLAGHGPIALVLHGWTERLILLQAFVVVCTCLGLNAAAMQRRQREGARQLSAALAEAEQAARVKSEFLANMSHEIRTPLTSILGFAALLAERDLGEEPNRYAGRVLSASRNLLALVNDVLDFSRLEAGRLELKPRAGDPDECGRDVVELFANQAAEKGLSLDFTPGGAAFLEADFDRVRQVLMNLVGNAVKFTAGGGVTVSYGYDPERGVLGYRVRDTGPGLDEEAQAKLFKRFSQVDAAVNRQHAGSGLGLAISKGLVEAMGGRIGVESAPGQGALFWFEIPTAVAPHETKARAAELDIGAFAGLKVLLVDDNAANRELIRSMLTPLGVALTTADGGEAAISLAGLQAFQLVLMDLRMPGVDGWTAARAIREGDGPNRATPILAFSADISADDQIAPDVFQDVVRKPIEMLELLMAIARWSREATPLAETVAEPVVARIEAPKRSQRRR